VISLDEKRIERKLCVFAPNTLSAVSMKRGLKAGERRWRISDLRGCLDEKRIESTF